MHASVESWSFTSFKLSAESLPVIYPRPPTQKLRLGTSTISCAVSLTKLINWSSYCFVWSLTKFSP